VNVQVRKSVVVIGDNRLPSKSQSDGREGVATMLNDAFGIGVAAAGLTARTFHAAHAAAPAAAVKHRAAATTTSVHRGHT
jgi:hypothetical protein